MKRLPNYIVYDVSCSFQNTPMYYSTLLIPRAKNVVTLRYDESAVKLDARFQLSRSFHLNIPEKCIPSFTFYLFYFGVNFFVSYFLFLPFLSSLSFVVLSFFFFFSFPFFFSFTTYGYFETRENTGSTNFPLQAPVWRIIFSLKI